MNGGGKAMFTPKQHQSLVPLKKRREKTEPIETRASHISRYVRISNRSQARGEVVDQKGRY